MRKVFTLVMAAVAVLTVNAAPARKMVRSFMSPTTEMTQSVDPKFSQIEANNALTFAKMSRAGEQDANDLVGRYYTGIYGLVAPNDGSNTPLAEFIEPFGYFDIEVDPSVENGYLIKGFGEEWYNDVPDEEPIEFKDLKATWDPEKKTLTVAPYQLLFETEWSDDHTPFNAHLVMAGADGYLSQTVPLVFKYQYGLLQMDRSVSPCFVFAEYVDDPDPKQSGYMYTGYQFLATTAYVPNGTLSCYMPDYSNNYEYPLHCVWLDGAVFVNNFTGHDALSLATFMVNNDKTVLSYDGKYGEVGQFLLIVNIPGQQQIDVNYTVYAAEMTENGEPTGTGYNVDAAIEVANDDAFKATFPTFGLFTEQDEYCGTVEDAVLEFVPGAIAGIKNVAAADADNTNAPVRYYNLQGMSVNNPANGIFIRVQGTDVQKVLVK